MPIRGPSWVTPSKMGEQIEGVLSRSGAVLSLPPRASFIHSLKNAVEPSGELRFYNQTKGLESWLCDPGS